MDIEYLQKHKLLKTNYYPFEKNFKKNSSKLTPQNASRRTKVLKKLGIKQKIGSARKEFVKVGVSISQDIKACPQQLELILLSFQKKIAKTSLKTIIQI